MGANESEVMVDRSARGWIVRVIGSKTVQSFSCATEEMAQRFAAMWERALHPIAEAA